MLNDFSPPSLPSTMADVFVCAASGPSLTQADCDLVISTGLPVIAINDTWRRFERLYALFAGDHSWWLKNYSLVPQAGFRRITASQAAKKQFPALEYRRYCANHESFNSGAMGIEFAADMGAKKVLLIGYDCCLKEGLHWHGAHPADLRNPTQHSIDKWHVEFMRARRNWPGVEIINCTRRTELKCYPLRNLEKEIESLLLAQDQAWLISKYRAACPQLR